MDLWILEHIAPIFYTLLELSLAAVCIGLGVLLLRKLLDKKIPPIWKNALWLLVLVALVMPFRPTSSTAVIPSTEVNFRQQENSLHAEITQDKTELDGAYQVPAELTQQREDLHAKSLVFEVVIPAIWLLGMVAMMGVLLATRQKMLRGMKTTGHHPLLDDCKHQLNITQTVEIVEQSYLKSPALWGLFRPKILLPDYVAEMSEDSQKYILLHELSHLKHHDLWKNTLLLALQIVYWFNPLVWVLFRFIRQDMELLNDERVLKTLQKSEETPYAMSLIEVLGHANKLPLAPQMLCMVDNKDNTKRRIQMIQLGEVFKKHKLIIAVGCLAVIAVLSALFLTAQPEVPDPGSTGNSKPITLEDYEAIEIGAAKETIREKFGEPHTYGNWGYDEIYVLLDGQVTISYDSDGETDTFVEDVSINTHARLSLNDVIMLSEKGEDLTWTDFEQFPYIEGGSGVYIRDYHINDLFCFSIGGGLTDDEPFYMTLYTKAGTDDSIDIRTENVTEFISKHGMGVGDWGVTLTATDVTPTGMTLTLAWDGEEDVTGTLMTGAWFAIDVLEDDAWTEVYAPRADWTEEAYDLPTTQKIDWEWLYGTLPSGIYRIEKEVLNIREPGDFDRLIYTAEFEVPEEIVGDPRLLTAEELTYFNDNYFDILYDQEDYYVRFSEGTRMGDTVTLTFRGYEPDTGDVHEMIAESLTLEQVDDKYIFVSRDYAA